MNKRIVKKVLTYGVCLCMAFMTVPILAEVTTMVSVAPENWGKVDTTYLENANNKVLDISMLEANANRTIEIPSNITNLTIKGSTSKTYTGLVIKAAGRSLPLKLTVQDLKIVNGSIQIAKTSGENYLYLKGVNSIMANNSAAVLVDNGDSKLIIDAADEVAKLTVVGANSCAGIGGTDINHGGHIVIQGGNITATGGNNAAGIGSGHQRSVKSVTIKGNAVIEMAQGGSNGGAGIGGSANGENLDKIEISENAYVIDAIGSNGAAGIGAGNQSGVRVIDIIGGTIGKLDASNNYHGAIGGYKAAGIGGGAQDKDCNMTINIRNTTIVYAKGGDDAAGIGGGYERGADINIGDGAIIEKAIGGKNGAGIGCGPNGAQKTINITGTSLIKLAQGGENAAGIGGGKTRSAKINISGGNIEYAKGGANGAGIGCGEGNNDANSINISGGVIYAEGGGGTYTNDIGAGNYRDVPGGKTQNDAKGVPVNITGGTVFTPNNTMIGKTAVGTHVNYVLVAYRNYDKTTKTGTVYTGANIKIRTTAGMDKELVCNSEGRTSFSWEDPTKSLEGYWFQINDTSVTPMKIYVGLKAETDASQWNTIYYDIDNNIVVAGSPSIERAVIEIPIIYEEGTVEATPTQTVTATVGEDKIVPYSTSTIGYGIKMSEITNKDPDIKEIKSVSAELEFIPDSGSKNCEVMLYADKATGGVVVEDGSYPSGDKKYKYVNKSTSEFQITPAATSTGNIKFKYSGNWIKADDYQIVAYIPTQGVKESSSEVELNAYKSAYVDAAYSIKVKVTNIKVEVKRQQYIIVNIPGGTSLRLPGSLVTEVVNLPDQELVVKFNEIPNIH
ncbi:autotransporter outer membrane beta-barrel domain-containing protein [Cellulosilyticum lentocellum]|uniref:Uncharacterized protein n=1 Tax=Cellulosilyticum lentocellum (strain ATCC 49066 / DSM 5427 / NCIMB 11756 / RHM5) TaxID=642492 RepID=F2JRX6_CELLD|nr:hypothetical protein [Cellulosilyticum lentocellum]ADZ82790.1 hypothetical protein Clole_1058 [Cellulosilyticum lentocellum DSM 5427]